MPDTLIILPAHFHDKDESLRTEMKLMERLREGALHVFYYAGDNAADLKKMLIERDFACIIMGFASLSTACPDLRMIRSLSLKSRFVLYYPDTDLVTETQSWRNSGADVRKWRETGRAIAVNMLRQADLIVVPSDEEAKKLLSSIPGLPVLAVGELQSGDQIVFRPAEAKKVSIIMLTFNQRTLTQKCVESLWAHTHSDFELIIVDNGSVDGTKEYLQQLAKEHDHVKVIFNSHNVGFSKANNQGIKIAEGAYVLLLNNDVILTEGWLERMLFCIDSDPEIGVVGPCTNNAVAQQVVGAQIGFNDADIQRFAHMQSISNAGDWFATHRIIGFCMLVKREVIEKIGMLDERFGPGGFEDYDFCLRINQAGYKIMIASDVFIYHIGGQGYHKNNLDYTKLREQNVQIFIEKWCRKALEAMEVMPDGM